MFIDQVKIYARAGHGGKGCVAFNREAFRPKGGPSGGNGGRGGDVILEADHDINNLVNQYYTPRLIAQNGNPGLGKGMDGLAGKDLIVKVPCGTMIWKLPDPPLSPEETPISDEEALSLQPEIRKKDGVIAWEFDLSKNLPVLTTQIAPAPEKIFVGDLLHHEQRLILCKGGRGGLGNRNFATPTRQAPRFAQPGEPGTEGSSLLELRLIADAALVGFPNAGKSTLLTAISRARPKIASYPFTTLHPQIGIVEYPYDYHRLTVCDVPGLIPGAHQNKGLGHAFLRHIRRCKIIVLLIDISAIEGRKPWDDYQQLLHELELYDAELLNRPRLILANKMDEPESEKNLKEFKQHLPGQQIIPLSAAFDEGISEFLEILRQAVAQAPEPPKQEVKSENIDLINGEHI